MQPQRDHALPPDLAAYHRADHPHGRVIVIAPTRAACETIELALGLRLDTLLEREHGEELRRWAAAGKGFGIVAGTGTGKTLGIRPVAETILQAPLRVGVVNREREATPETPTWNVIIVTTGIARRWFQDGLITGRDTVVVDEIHQTSAELELCLALGKRAGCRYIWLSATVDPTFYASYLDSAEVLETSAFDPALRARVEVLPKRPVDFLDDRFVRHVMRERRGVAVFVPTRAEVETLARELGERWPRLNAAFYHGGEPVRVIRPFLEGEGVEPPFLLAMTAAGQSALNIRGLDTVVIYDARYGNVVDRGRNVLHRLYLGANEILQMAGRVHGRVAGGEVYILTDRDLDFTSLRPGPPEFQLAGDAERVALTCAAIGVDARELDLPVPLDRVAYRRAVGTLAARGLVADGRLTRYGRQVEALPVERPWGEMLIHADADLVPTVAVCSSVDSLHRMTRDERDLRGLIASGSDHLTAYNVYAEALGLHGTVGEVYGLPRHVFDEEGLAEWAEGRGVLVKSIEDIALGLASVYRALELPLPTGLPQASKEVRRRFAELIARVQSLDVVLDGEAADGQPARVSRTSVAGTWGAVAGSLRFFADRFGVPRASIEGTTLGYDLIRRHARTGEPRVILTGPRRDPRLAVESAVTFAGFTLETEVKPLDGVVPEALRPAMREVLVDALLDGRTGHRLQSRLRRAVHQLDEYWRRSGGALRQAAPGAVRDHLLGQVQGVDSQQAFLEAELQLDVESLVDAAERSRLDALPGSVRLLGDTVPLEYAVEQQMGVVVLRLRAGQARRIRPKDLPDVDRPLRFAVEQGHRPVLRAASLAELADLMAGAGRDRKSRREAPSTRREGKPGKGKDRTRRKGKGGRGKRRN